MAEEADPHPNPREENGPAHLAPDEAAAAVEEVNKAMGILPKTRFGCLGGLAALGAVPLLLLAVFVYWNLFRTPRLRISAETTYITEPRTGDGTRVDYFAALERDHWRPEMETDENGYRLIVRALGPATDGEVLDADVTPPLSVQVYERLGLDPALEPTMTLVEPFDFLRAYGVTHGLDEAQVRELTERFRGPWTLDDLPMMAPWLEQNGPVADLVADAVRRPHFRWPLVRPQEQATLVETISLAEMQRVRSLARILVARADYRIGTGDIEGAIDDVITCQRLGRHLESHDTVVARLVGIAIRGMGASVGIAAVRQWQPTDEQLRRFADELSAIPPRADADRMWLAERYYALDWVQTLAFSDESLAAHLSALGDVEGFSPGFTAYASIDWNIVMRRVNAQFDGGPEGIHAPWPPNLRSPDNLLLGVRSRRVADLIAEIFMPPIQAFREATHRSSCTDNLHQITLAMLRYEREHGTLPPAYTVDADGTPLHSWRVILLPYLGEQELFAQLRLDEPWDSGHNRRFHDAALAVYQCPSADLPAGQTTYSVVVGRNTAFRGGQGTSLDELGMNLILVVEREQPVCWMDPASELSESTALAGINRAVEGRDGIGSPHPGGMNVALRAGSVRFIPETIDPDSFRALLDGTADE